MGASRNRYRRLLKSREATRIVAVAPGLLGKGQVLFRCEPRGHGCSQHIRTTVIDSYIDDQPAKLAAILQGLVQRFVQYLDGAVEARAVGVAGERRNSKVAKRIGQLPIGDAAVTPGP